MNDGEIQVSGESMRSVSAEEFGIKDDGEHVSFTDALTDPEALSAEGHQHMKQITDEMGRAVEQRGQIENEDARAALKQWGEEARESLDDENRKELNKNLEKIGGVTIGDQSDD